MADDNMHVHLRSGGPCSEPRSEPMAAPDGGLSAGCGTREMSVPRPSLRRRGPAWRGRQRTGRRERRRSASTEHDSGPPTTASRAKLTLACEISFIAVFASPRSIYGAVPQRGNSLVDRVTYCQSRVEDYEARLVRLQSRVGEVGQDAAMLVELLAKGCPLGVGGPEQHQVDRASRHADAAHTIPHA
jgi:hypothetical protein